MFGTILLIACVLMQAYVCWRASSVPWVRRHISVSRLIIMGGGLWLFVVAPIVGAVTSALVWRFGFDSE